MQLATEKETTTELENAQEEDSENTNRGKKKTFSGLQVANLLRQKSA